MRNAFDILESLFLLIENRVRSFALLDDAALVAFVNFAKLFRTLASFFQSLLQLHSRLLFSQRLALSQFPSIEQNEAKSPIKEKDLFFPSF